MANPSSSPRVTKAAHLREWVASRSRSECWVWPWACNPKNHYAQVTFEGRGRPAGHVSLEMDGRPRPSADMVMRHRCHNRPCVNPDHLAWGTASENTIDTWRDDNHSNAKFSVEQVKEIRRRRAAGEKGRHLAAEFGVHEMTIYKMTNGRSWAFVS